MRKLLRQSLSKKMIVLEAIILVPMLALIFYLMATLASFSSQYNQTVKNITKANEYTLNFKEDMDYSMYRIIIGSIAFDEISELDEIRNPYEMIEQIQSQFSVLESSVEEKDAIDSAQNVQGYLKTLKLRIDDIKNNLDNGGSYDENYDLWDKSVLVLTSLIEDEIHRFIQIEVQVMEEVRIRLQRQERNALLISMIALAVLAVVISALSHRIVQSITGPIRKLCKEAEQVGEGDFTLLPADLEAGDEVVVLNHSFHDMVAKIEQLIEDIKIEQNNLRNAELQLLQTQINPHFLYNTLDTIVWLAEDEQMEQVVQMVTSLSDFFRTVLSEGKDFITIQEEKNHISSYLKIQQFRYQDIMDYEIDFQPEILNCRILKLTLQPLIENALYHGIKNKRGKGKILVTGKKDGNIIRFEVSDDGIGMTAEELQRLVDHVEGQVKQHTGGFGLANVEERIQLNYGKEYGMHFSSEPGKGTKVTLTIPMQK